MLHISFQGRMDFDGDGRSFYDGDWVNNVRHGWGLRQYTSGNMYQGMWFNHVRHGEGTMKWLDRDQIYSGQWENGIQVRGRYNVSPRQIIMDTLLFCPFHHGQYRRVHSSDSTFII